MIYTGKHNAGCSEFWDSLRFFNIIMHAQRKNYMEVFHSLKEVITGKPAIKGAIFLKEDSDAEMQLEKMQELLEIADAKTKKQIEDDIRILKYGIEGEKQIAYELKASFYPMIVLHDLHLEFEGITAQIDYIIFTKKLALVIECKNLYGNIEINNKGDFIRTSKKECIYSPITQNKRHLEILKQIKLSQKGFIMKMVANASFNDLYKTVVVLANPKTIMNDKYAKKEIKSQIIRCDQLIEYIKRLDRESKLDKSSDEEMMHWAESILKYHTPNTVDYTAKYGINISDSEQKIVDTVIPSSSSNTERKLEDMSIFQEIRAFRTKVYHEENLGAAYLVFNDKVIEQIVSIMPKSIEELKMVKGLGEVKCQKYGDEIIKICGKYR